jgi:hypothetical protein
MRSSGDFEYETFGLFGDAIVPGDYDGDGKSDLCVARIGSDGSGNFFIRQSSTGTVVGPIVFGNAGTDSLAPGDYDGDGATDIGIWRKSVSPAQFWIRSTATGNVTVQQWGQSTDEVVSEKNVTGGP